MSAEQVNTGKDIYYNGRIYVGCGMPIPDSDDHKYNQNINDALFYNDFDKWTDHLKTLTSYELTGSHQFSNGQEVKEGVDYKKGYQHSDLNRWYDVNHYTYAHSIVHDSMKRIIATPLIRSKGETVEEFDTSDIEDIRIIIKAKGKHWSIVPKGDSEEARQLRIVMCMALLQEHCIVSTSLEDLKLKTT